MGAGDATWGCYRKARYTSFAQAEAIRRRVFDMSGVRLRVATCLRCGGYHLMRRLVVAPAKVLTAGILARQARRMGLFDDDESTVDDDRRREDLDMASAIATALDRARFRVSDEAELQEATRDTLARMLDGMPSKFAHLFEREVKLEDERGRPCGRVDFLIDRVALELKVAGSRAAALRQVCGYARSERVGALVVASTRASLLGNWPASLLGKRILVVHLRGWP